MKRCEKNLRVLPLHLIQRRLSQRAVARVKVKVLVGVEKGRSKTELQLLYWDKKDHIKQNCFAWKREKKNDREKQSENTTTALAHGGE